MQSFFRILRWFLALSVGVLFSVILTVTILGITLSLTFSNPDNLKSWLADTDLYENAFDEGMRMISEKAEEDPDEDNILADLNNPSTEVHQLVYNLVTPEYIETRVNIVIDAIYVWLEGDTQMPQFEIGLSDDPETIDKIIILGFTEKVASLPLCDGFPKVPEGYNPLDASCRPEEYSLDQVEDYIADLHDNPKYEEFVASFNINSEDILEISPEQSEKAQTGFLIFKVSPILLILLAFIVGLVYSALIPGVANGFMSMGSVTFLVGSVFAAITFFSDILLDKLYSEEMRVYIEQYVEIPSDEVYEIATDLAKNMVNALGETLLRVSLVTAAVGLVIITITFIVTRAKNKPENKIYKEED